MIKRRANAVTRGTGDSIKDFPLRQMVQETIARVKEQSFSGPMVCDWSRHQSVGRRKLPGNRRAPGTR